MKKSWKIDSKWIYDVLDEFAPDDTIWNPDDPDISRLKNIIYNELPESDRRIILAYAELESLKDTARLLKVSVTTLWKKVHKIQDTIKQKLTDKVQFQDP